MGIFSYSLPVNLRRSKTFDSRPQNSRPSDSAMKSRILNTEAKYLRENQRRRLRLVPFSSPEFPLGVSRPTPRSCHRPYSRNSCESSTPLTLSSIRMERATTELSNCPVSMTPSRVICSFHIFIIVSLNAVTYLRRSSIDCLSEFNFSIYGIYLLFKRAISI